MKDNGSHIFGRDCVFCGKEFVASRSHAKTCSDNCRKKLSLKRQAIYDFEQQFYQQLRKLESQVTDPELGPDAFYVLSEIERRLCKAKSRASKTDMAKGLAMQA